MTIRNDRAQDANHRLRRLRQETGVKVGPFATMVGCSQPHLTSCENGNRDPSPELAAVIARELSRLLCRSVTVGDFLPRADQVPDEPPPQPKPPKPPKKRKERAGTGPRRDDDSARGAA